MERRLSIPIGVIVSREAADNPWQDYVWHLAGVVIGGEVGDGWRALDEGPTDGTSGEKVNAERFFAGSYELEVFRRETEAYQVNLNNKVPVVYVVMREADDPDATQPLDVHLVTVSAYEAQDYLDTGEEIVETVAMPAPLLAWVQRFIDRHHVEEKFVKRKRNEVRQEDHKFGQEPIFVREGRARGQDH